MPIPEKKIVVPGGKPVRTGTRNVAPNIATTCCSPMPTVAGQPSRSSGRTTSPGAIERPSPWRVQTGVRGTTGSCGGWGRGGATVAAATGRPGPADR